MNAGPPAPRFATNELGAFLAEVEVNPNDRKVIFAGEVNWIWNYDSHGGFLFSVGVNPFEPA